VSTSYVNPVVTILTIVALLLGGVGYYVYTEHEKRVGGGSKVRRDEGRAREEEGAHEKSLLHLFVHVLSARWSAFECRSVSALHSVYRAALAHAVNIRPSALRLSIVCRSHHHAEEEECLAAQARQGGEGAARPRIDTRLSERRGHRASANSRYAPIGECIHCSTDIDSTHTLALRCVPSDAVHASV
jgi:hypothetical protein